MSLKSVIAAAGEKGIVFNNLGGKPKMRSNWSRLPLVSYGVLKLTDGREIGMSEGLCDKVNEQRKLEESRPGHENRRFTIDSELGLVELTSVNPYVADKILPMSDDYETSNVQNLLGLSEEDYKQYGELDAD